MQRSKGTKGFQPISAGPRLSGDELLRAVDAPLASVPPATVPPASAQAQPAPKPAKPAPFMLRLAPAVFRALEQAAGREGATMTVMVARALKDAGYPVPESDLKDRRRRRDYAAMAAEGQGEE
jgi:hypothetical protein